MRRQIILIAAVAVLQLVPVGAAYMLGLARGERLVVEEYEEMISTSEQLADVRVDLEAARCEERIVSVLMQIDLSGWGKWATADGEITLEPVGTKQVASTR